MEAKVGFWLYTVEILSMDPLPPENHYRWYTFYNIDTGEDTTPDTVAFFPELTKMANFSSRDMAIHATADMKRPWKNLAQNRPFK